MTALIPYAGAPKRGGGYIPPNDYARWLRSTWITRCGRKTRSDLWTPTEDATALDMRSRGKSYGQIAIKVQRTPCAVAARLRYLGEAAQ